MTKTFDLSNFSDEELASLIDEATSLRDTRRASRERERSVGSDGSMGQDVKAPDHGVIPTPTPREVKDEGRAHSLPK